MSFEGGGVPEEDTKSPEIKKMEHLQKIEESEEEFPSEVIAEKLSDQEILSRIEENNVKQLLLEIENDPDFAEWDVRWYDKIVKLARIEDFELLMGDSEKRKEQKEKFINGEIEAPVLDYPKLDEGLESREQAFLDLKEQIINDKYENKLVKQVYRWRINEEIATTRMLKATRDGDNRRFEKYAKFIYGSVDKRIFDFTRLEALEYAGVEEFINSDDPEIKETAEKLKENITKGEINPIELPDLKIPPVDLSDKEIHSAGILKEACENALSEMKAEGWEIIVTDKVTGVAIYHGEKAIKIASTRKFSDKNIAGLIKHEIGTHLKRRIEGERSRLKLLGPFGLDRYLKGEEGVATYEQQKVSGAEEYSGFVGYFLAGLAKGVDGEPRTFKEVFEIMSDYLFLKNIKKGKKKEEAHEKAKNDAYNGCVRTFRGLNDLDKTRGLYFPRDLTYRKGNIATWELVRQNPDVEMTFMLGKFDPNNPRHTYILTELGITDKDLDYLQK